MVLTRLGETRLVWSRITLRTRFERLDFGMKSSEPVKGMKVGVSATAYVGFDMIHII